MSGVRPVGRCLGCFHDFITGPCGGCGAVLSACTADECPEDCEPCGSGDWPRMCDDCRFYAAQDAIPATASPSPTTNGKDTP